MINFYEFSKQSRCDTSLCGVYSYMIHNPYTVIKKVVNEPKERHFVVRVHFYDTKRDKPNIISYGFYRRTESQEANDFINCLCDTFHVSPSGDPVF